MTQQRNSPLCPGTRPHASTSAAVPPIPVVACLSRSDVKAKVEKRNQYSRHYAFKGRGRKEHLHGDAKMDRCELVPARGT
jgi:hypothetical protein